MTEAALVVGYGNTLRSDDGFGWHAAGLLADDLRLDGVTVLQRHQLTPELAFDISSAALVVLIDATRNRLPAPFAMCRVEQGGDAATTWSHHLSPSGLVALAYELYGCAPDVFLFSGAAASIEVGDRLSPTVEAALPQVVDAVAELVTSRPLGQSAKTLAFHRRAWPVLSSATRLADRARSAVPRT